MNNDISDAAQRLADLLAQENDALKRMDFASAVALMPAKEAALADLTQRPPHRTMSPLLAALGRHLTGLATENQALLERAIAVQTRVVRIVVRACAPPPMAAGYGGRPGRTLSNRATAMALSTRA